MKKELLGSCNCPECNRGLLRRAVERVTANENAADLIIFAIALIVVGGLFVIPKFFK